MAAGGIPWIPEFWLAIIFIVCQRVLLRIKLSEVCGRPGFLLRLVYAGIFRLLIVRWHKRTGCAGKKFQVCRVCGELVIFYENLVCRVCGELVIFYENLVCRVCGELVIFDERIGRPG